MNTTRDVSKKASCETNKGIKSSIMTAVLTDVAVFVLLCFVAQTDFKTVYFTGQITKTRKKKKHTVCNSANINRPKWGGSPTHLLEVELLGEDGILPFSWMRLGNLDVVQVDVAVRVGKILHRQLVGLLHIQHQAAHLRQKSSTHT